MFILSGIMLLTVMLSFLKIKERTIQDIDTTVAAYAFLVVGIVALVVLFFVGIYIIKKNIDICKFYLFSMIILSCVYMVIFLPFTVPDEPAHYFSAYRFSNFFLLDFDQFNKESLNIRQSDAEFYTNIATTALSGKYYDTIKDNFHLFSNNNTIVEYSVNFVANAPFGYIASGLGIAVARLFRLSPVITFYFGRIFNMAAYIALTYVAIKRIPFGKTAVFAISVLPMTLHLVASYSYDSLAISMSLMYVSQVLYICEKEGTAKLSDIIFCGIYGVILAPTKLVYAPILLLIFIIPKEKLGFSAKKSFLVKSAVVILGAIVLLLVQGASMVRTASNVEAGWSGTPYYSISWILNNPVSAIKIFLNSFFEKGDFYISTMIGGSLGWFQITVPLYCYLPFILILSYSYMRRDDEIAVFNFNKKLISLFAAVSSVFLIFFSMFIAWTPIGYGSIEGVQGRYFLPILPLLYVIVRNKIVTVKHDYDKYFIFFALYFSMLIAIMYFMVAFA